MEFLWSLKLLFEARNQAEALEFLIECLITVQIITLDLMKSSNYIIFFYKQ